MAKIDVKTATSREERDLLLRERNALVLRWTLVLVLLGLVLESCHTLHLVKSLLYIAI